MVIHNKDDIEFVTEFPCLLGHPVQCTQQLTQSYEELEEFKNIELTIF